MSADGVDVDYVIIALDAVGAGSVSLFLSDVLFPLRVSFGPNSSSLPIQWKHSPQPGRKSERFAVRGAED